MFSLQKTSLSLRFETTTTVSVGFYRNENQSDESFYKQLNVNEVRDDNLNHTMIPSSL